MNMKRIFAGILVIALSLALGFGFNALIVWAVCKIMGWAFAWKWVILFTIVYTILSSLFQNKK